MFWPILQFHSTNKARAQTQTRLDSLELTGSSNARSSIRSDRHSRCTRSTNHSTWTRRARSEFARNSSRELTTRKNFSAIPSNSEQVQTVRTASSTRRRHKTARRGRCTRCLRIGECRWLGSTPKERTACHSDGPIISNRPSGKRYLSRKHSRLASILHPSLKHVGPTTSDSFLINHGRRTRQLHGGCDETLPQCETFDS